MKVLVGLLAKAKGVVLLADLLVLLVLLVLLGLLALARLAQVLGRCAARDAPCPETVSFLQNCWWWRACCCWLWWQWPRGGAAKGRWHNGWAGCRATHLCGQTCQQGQVIHNAPHVHLWHRRRVDELLALLHRDASSVRRNK